MKGAFITLEGVEGCGKTTQMTLLRDRLETEGRRVLLTREPGGTPIAEAIRDILLDPANTALSPVAELLLYEAARAQHVAERIRPALDEGAIVICDRFADSTTAYQGAGRVLPGDAVRNLHRLATGAVWPDLTIVLDLPPEEGLKRAAAARTRDRIEREPLEFHQRVRREFLRIAESEPERVKVVDAAQTPEAVAAAIYGLVRKVLKQP
ncbi:MAG TPA: dTMP kinase [Candidatus Hydrogenedentes bacterium]|jgi:dTMP kinase|nr:dTMP kinase [Candidatus Hydrogenedentota bacterium]HNV21192.1 dTMP kinase [Candidatus Hydrogenedentota bacterium]HNZ19200.1 dTMP kinase [Candidatus Hydrogenedentota bacterium]HOH32830.1 dTMP kinase [Candidatus Hydrogenedentota bacterium]HPA05393.1 dTMP kinase [Candidatus Hydrogenedentota bacterium]